MTASQKLLGCAFLIKTNVSNKIFMVRCFRGDHAHLSLSISLTPRVTESESMQVNRKCDGIHFPKAFL